MRTSRDYKTLAKDRMFKRVGTLIGATTIYGAIYIAIVMALLMAYTMNILVKGVFNSVETMQTYMNNMMNDYRFYIMTQVVAVLVGALMSTISVAIQYMCLKVARGQEVKISDMLYVVKNNPDKVIVLYIIQEALMLLFSVPANILSYMDVGSENVVFEMFEFILIILSYVADIFIVVMFSQAMLLYIDNPMESAFKCIEMSNHVMRKYFGKYLFLLISFIPLYIIATLTFGIMYIWLLPYKYTTFALFYMQLKGELGSTIDVTIQ